MAGAALVPLIALLSLADPVRRPEAWVARYDSPSRSQDRARAMAIDPLGNVYVAGTSSRSSSARWPDTLTLKYDPLGKELWSAREEWPQGVELLPFAIGADGGGNSYVALGTNQLIHPLSTASVVVKYDADGRRAWQVSHAEDPTTWSAPLRVVVDGDGLVYLVGLGGGVDSDEVPLVSLIQYDPDGTERWEVYSPGEIIDETVKAWVAIDPHGESILAGGSTLSKHDRQGREIWGVSNLPFVLLGLAVDGEGNSFVAGKETRKFDPDGRLVWSVKEDRHRIGPMPENHLPQNVLAVDAAGQVTVAVLDNVWAYDPAGNLLWEKDARRGQRGIELIQALGIDREGSLYLASLFSEDRETTGSSILKLDREGEERWFANYEGSGLGAPKVVGVAIDGDGRVHVSSTSLGFGSGEDFTTVTYDRDGNRTRVERYDQPGSGNDSARLIAVDPQGGIHVVGDSQDMEYRESAFLRKYGPDGREEWAGKIRGPQGQEIWPAAITLASDGSLWMAGGRSAPDAQHDFIALRIGPQGELLASTSYAIPAGATAHVSGIALDGDENVYVVGTVRRVDGFQYGVAIRYDPAGRLLWETHFPPSGSNSLYIHGLQVDQTGNLFVVASIDNGAGSRAPLALKLNPHGWLQWLSDEQGPGPGEFVGWSFGLDCAGNLYVAGSLKVEDLTDPNTGEADIDLAVVKFDPDGKPLWRARIGGAEWTFAEAISVDCEGSASVTGFSNSVAGGIDRLILKLDPEGRQIWKARATDDSGGRGSLAVDSTGNVYVTRGVGARPTTDIDTLKYSPGGELLWEGRFRPPDCWSAWPSSIALDPFGNLFIAGVAWSDRTAGDAIVLKYATDRTSFIRGDCDGSGRLGLNDAISLLRYLYAGGGEPPCLSACDADGDGDPAGFRSDAILILRYLFLAGPAPRSPFPRCETAPTDGFDCRTFTSC